MTDGRETDTVRIEVDAGVATVTLDRPPRNEYTVEMGAALNRAFLDLEADDSVRAIVVTGSGDYFCAGAALAGRRDGADEDEAGRTAATERAVPWEMSTPIIAAINGPAVGVGLTLPLQWDIRLAAEDAKMGLVFVRRGWVAELGAHWVVPRLIGVSRAMELMITGRVFTGREAAEMGLVSRALPADQVLPAAREMAHEIAENCAPVSVAITKKLVWSMLEESSHDAAQITDNGLFRWSTRQPDGTEGVRAFLDKRPPEWTMSKTRDLPPDMA